MEQKKKVTRKELKIHGSNLMVNSKMAKSTRTEKGYLRLVSKICLGLRLKNSRTK